MFDRKDFTIPKIHEKPPIERLTVSCNSDPLSKKILKLDIQNFQSQTYFGINGVNIDTNEYGSVQIIQKLAETKAARNSCHIGVSGWYNLHVIAARQTSRGIIFDSNPDVSLFFDHTFKYILECPNRETFIAKMKSCVSDYDFNFSLISENLSKHSFRIAPNLLCPSACSPQDEIEICSKTPGSWLENEESYSFIRDLVSNNKIIVITRDITDHEAFQRMRNLLNDNGILIDTLYLSNVHHYMYSLSNKHDFLKTFSFLSDNNTWLIDSHSHSQYDLEQKLVFSEALNSTDKQFIRWFPTSSKEVQKKT
jgi:hypothetical protein